MKVVINVCYGGFGLSTEACEWLIKNKNWKVTEYNDKGSLVDKTADLVIAYSGRIISTLTKEKHEKFYGKYHLVKDDYKAEFRTNADVIEVVEKLGKNADGQHAKLKIVNIPDGIEFEIEEYDGNEHISEKHRTWR